jgi:hypothetical protein
MEVVVARRNLDGQGSVIRLVLDERHEARPKVKRLGRARLNLGVSTWDGDLRAVAR